MMTAAFILALAQSILSVSATCNPTTATTTCPGMPAMPSSTTYTLSPSDTADFTYQMGDGITGGGDDSGLVFTLAAQGDAPTMITNDYLLYGNVKAKIKSAPGVGMVSAFILMSDVLDEVDWEWLGADDNEVQTNYYYRGLTADYNRGGISAVSSPEETTHVYEIDWTESTLTWLIDGVTVRTLTKASTAGYGYPDTPCQIKVGVWASGDPTNAEGTIEWGGGPIDYAAGPYSMTLYSLSVTSYTNAKSFSWNADGSSFSISQTGVSGNTATTAGSQGKTTAQSGTTKSSEAAVAAAGKSTLSTTTKSASASSSTDAGQVVVVAAAAQVVSSGVSTRKSTTSTSTSRTSTRTSSTRATSGTALSSTNSNAASIMTPFTTTTTMTMGIVLGLTWFAGFVLF